MPTPQHNLESFLDAYRKYVDAKEKKNPQTWLIAIHCRTYLQRLAGYADKEEKTFREIFEPFVSKKKIEEMYKELCDDSKSYSQD